MKYTDGICKCGTVMDENGVDKTEEYYGGTV